MKWDESAPLKPGMLRNPVIESRHVELPDDAMEPSNGQLDRIIRKFKTMHLQTWGREGEGASTLDPHWICVTQGTPLHTDPKYPRYTHQLYLRVDPMTLHGVAFRRTPLSRGLYVCLDTHSPHKVSKLDPAACWYFAAAVDSHKVEQANEMLALLVDYLLAAPLSQI